MAKLRDLVLDENGIAVTDDQGKLVTKDNSTLLGRTARTALNGVVFGAGDEILDALGATETAENLRRDEDRLAEENPYLNFGAQAAGALVPGGLIGKALGVGGKGIGLASNIIRSAGAGAVEGAAAGAGYADGEDASGRLTSAAIGAGIGTATGGVLATGGGLVRKGLRDRNLARRKAAAETAAETLGVDSATLLQRLQDGDSINKIALDAAGGDQTAAFNNLTALAQNDNGSVLRSLGRASQRAERKASEQLSDTASKLKDDLADVGSTSLDNIDTDDNALRIIEDRKSIGEDIGKARADIDANINQGEIVENIIGDPDFGAAAKDRLETILNSIGGLDASDQIMHEGQKIGKFVVLGRKEAADEGFNGAGLFARRKKVVNGKVTDDYEFVPADVDANVYSSLAQELQASGRSLLNNSAEDASSTTYIGDRFTKASNQITEYLNEASPELSELNAKFISNDGEERIINVVNSLFGDKSSSNRATSIKKLREILEGKHNIIDQAGNKIENQNISDDVLLDAVRAGLKEQMDARKVLDFDQSDRNYHLFKDIYQRAGAEDEFEELVKEIKSHNVVVNVVEELNETLDGSSLTKSTDPVQVGKSLSKIFDSPAMQRAIDELPPEEANTYRKVMEELIDEIKLSKQLTTKATTPIVDTPTLLQGIADNIPFAAVVFNTLGKILMVSGLRGARDSHMIARKGARRFGLNAEQMTNLINNDPKVLTTALADEYRKAINSGYESGILERAIRKAAVISAVQPSDDTGTVVEGKETSNGDGPPDYKEASGSPWSNGSGENIKFSYSGRTGPPIYDNTSTGTPANWN